MTYSYTEKVSPDTIKETHVHFHFGENSPEQVIINVSIADPDQVEFPFGPIPHEHK